MKIICVFEGRFHQEALMVSELLESNNIPCFMPNKHVAGIYPHYSLATGGYTVSVGETLFREAAEIVLRYGFPVQNQQLLEEIIPDTREIVLEVCPMCGEKSLETVIEPRVVLPLLVLALMVIPLPAKRVLKKCNSCNYRNTLFNKIIRSIDRMFDSVAARICKFDV